MASRRLRAGWPFALGALVFAGAVLFLYPRRGAARRALFRDRARSLKVEIGDKVDKQAKDVARRIQGRRYVAEHAHERVADDRLVDRVRAQLGRRVSHAHAIHVEAHEGSVTISGPVLREELRPLLHLLKEVRGVRTVVNRLEVHDRPGGATGANR